MGAIIDMKEGTIKYQFPLKKGMEHFPTKRMKLPLILLFVHIMVLMRHLLIILEFYFVPSSKALNKSAYGIQPTFISCYFILFASRTCTISVAIPLYLYFIALLCQVKPLVES